MPDTAMPGPFVAPAWLAVNLDAPDLRVVDGSWHLPAAGRDARAEYLAGHVPGAVFLDIDAVRDEASRLPHMLPLDEVFAAHMARLGLSETDRIVVYDGAGLFSAPRVRWMLRAYGATRVSILEGGLPAWVAEGRPLEGGEARPAPGRFVAQLDRSLVAGVEEVRAALADGSALVLDARPADRFRGEASEPRPGVRPGHIPGSASLPFPALVEEGRLVAPARLADTLAGAGAAPDRPMIASCGSGVSAAILSLAAEVAGFGPGTIYDGSWAEWGSRPDLPVATGPAKP